MKEIQVLYHLIPDKRYGTGYRRVRILESDNANDLHQFIQWAQGTYLGKLGKFEIMPKYIY